MTVLLTALALLAVGAVLGLPGRLLVLMLAIFWGAALLAHLVLPEGHAIARALGGDVRIWGAAGVVAALALLYRQGLAMLRHLAKPAQPSKSKSLSDAELERYARHIVLREVGGMGQRRLKEAKVLVVGAGGDSARPRSSTSPPPAWARSG